MAPRSYLFVPGDSPDKIGKAVGGSADAVIVDLEDAVAPARKIAARRTVVDALASVDRRGRPVLLRVNAVGSGLAHDDVLATLAARPDGYVVPKVADAATLRRFRDWLAAAGVGDRPVYALIESALGVLNLRELVLGDAPPAGLLFGGEDFLASVGGVATAGRHELAYARGAVVAAAAAAAIPAVDTVFIDYRDADGLRADALLARQMGFDGKLVVHPAQVAVVNAVWTPDSAEIAAARTLLTQFAQHAAAGVGVFTVDGRMIDEAVVRRARQIVARAEGE